VLRELSRSLARAIANGAAVRGTFTLNPLSAAGLPA
jgi:hypothetical protein